MGERDKFNVRTRYLFLSQNFIPPSQINKKKLFKKLKKGKPENYTLKQWRKIAKQLSKKGKNVNTYDIMSIYFKKNRKAMIGFTRKKAVICKEFNETIREDKTIPEEEKTFADPSQLIVRWEQNLDKKRGSWTDEESIRLMFARELYKGCQNTDNQFEWKRVGPHVAGRSSAQCRERYTKVLFNPNKFQKEGEKKVQGIIVKKLRKPTATKKKNKKCSLKIKKKKTSSRIRPVKRKRTKKSCVSKRKKLKL